MDDQELLSLAASLEALADQSLARVQRAEPARVIGVTANRSGFLRLAAWCLRAAVEPIKLGTGRSRPVQVTLPHGNVVRDETDLVLGFLERQEDWPSPEVMAARGRRRDRFALLSCAILGLVLLFVFSVGIATIVGWF